MSTHDRSTLAPSNTPRPHAFEEFLEAHLGQEMLRFTTAGSVDDGKSTLIGRLLHDTKSVYEDQLAAVKKSRVNRAANGHVDFSLLTDGSEGGARAGHHHRRRLSLLLHRAAQVHHRGHARPRAVHAQHGDRRVHRGRGDYPDRCQGVCQGRRAAAAVAPAHLHRVAAGDSACGRGGEQDGPGGLLAGELRCNSPRVRCAVRTAWPGRRR